MARDEACARDERRAQVLRPSPRSILVQCNSRSLLFRALTLGESPGLLAIARRLSHSIGCIPFLRHWLLNVSRVSSDFDPSFHCTSILSERMRRTTHLKWCCPGCRPASEVRELRKG